MEDHAMENTSFKKAVIPTISQNIFHFSNIIREQTGQPKNRLLGNFSPRRRNAAEYIG
jgi:hypothetical protein